MKLEAKQIRFTYPGSKEPVLNDVSLTLESHQRLGLLGPSGLGKTTLAKILCGYEKPDGGEVLLDGKALPKRGYCPVQMIWQHPERSVNPRLKMKEVIAEGDQVEERIIQELGIERDWFERYPQELSGGEMQRFCIARALGKRTKFLVADEISTMLDLITQSQIWNFLLKEVSDRNIGLLVISHSQELLDYVCTEQVSL